MAVEEQPMREDAELGSAARAPPPSQQHGGGNLPPGGTRAGQGAPGDDELTSLTWLQDTNLLRKLAGGEENQQQQMGDGAARGGEDTPGGGSDDEEEEDGGSREWGPPGQVPYNPQVHVNSKPPYSFSCLIFMAIEESPGKALPVKDIYAWILGHFPYFQSAPTGWKNSVRHNLSLNKCFRKVDKEKGQNIGKGSLWCIDPEYRPNLLQAMRKTPCFPYTQLSNWGGPATPALVPSQDNCSDKASSLDPAQTHSNVPSPTLFPYLSKRLAASSMKDQDVDAAATMLALQNGPSILPLHSEEDEEDGYRESSPCPKAIRKKHLRLRSGAQGSSQLSGGGARHRHLEDHCSSRASRRLGNGATATPAAVAPTATTVITSSPSEDHTYSASLANGSSLADSPSFLVGSGTNNSNNNSSNDLLVVVKQEPPDPDVYEEAEEASGVCNDVGWSGLSRLPVSSVPPRKRRAALVAAEEATPPRKTRKGGAAWRRNATAVRGVRRDSSGEAEEMAEGAHALLNLAKVATSQQQMLLLGGGGSGLGRQAR